MVLNHCRAYKIRVKVGIIILNQPNNGQTGVYKLQPKRMCSRVYVSMSVQLLGCLAGWMAGWLGSVWFGSIGFVVAAK